VTENPADTQEQPTEVALDWDDPSTLPIEEVKELFVSLGKALRAQQLYDANNPVYQRFVTQLGEGLSDLWGRMDRLQVHVEEDRLTWMGEEVYKRTTRADSLAFLLFKDGVREFTIHDGLEKHELPALLQVLNRARDLRPEGDDLLTILWETDLQYLTYTYVDLLAEGVELPSRGEGFPGGFQEIIEEETGGEADARQGEEGEGEEGVAPTQVSAEDFNPTLYTLDPSERARIQEEIEEELNRDLRADVLAALFDRVEEPRFPGRQAEILDIFGTLLPNFLSRGALSSAGAVLEEITRLLSAEAALKPEHRLHAERILDEVSAAETIQELVQAIRDGTISPRPTDLASFLRYLRPGALEPLIRVSEETGDRRIKDIIQEAVKVIAQRYRSAVIECIHSPDPVVAAGACSLAGKIQLSEAGPAIAGLLKHEDPQVRMAAVEAAVDLKASTAVGALQESLSDPNRDVRVAAAKGLGVLRYRPAAPYFREIIQGREIRQADISEQIAVFESFGRLQDPDGVLILDELLNGRGFLGRRESGEIRACAALGLGKIGTPEAMEALRKAADESDPVVRTAVNRALRGEG
jgi:HEAT repeat protein